MILFKISSKILSLQNNENKYTEFQFLLTGAGVRWMVATALAAVEESPGSLGRVLVNGQSR
jgi:hypothetical protein